MATGHSDDRFIPFAAAERLIMEVVNEMEVELGSKFKKGIWIGAAGGAAIGTGVMPIIGTAIGALTGALSMVAVGLTTNTARTAVRGKRLFEVMQDMTLDQLDDVIRILSRQHSYPAWSKQLVYNYFDSGEMAEAVAIVLAEPNVYQ